MAEDDAAVTAKDVRSEGEPAERDEVDADAEGSEAAAALSAAATSANFCRLRESPPKSNSISERLRDEMASAGDDEKEQGFVRCAKKGRS